MANTHFTGPVYSTNGFVGAVTGAITGDVTGNTTGVHTGYQVATQQALSGAGAVNVTTDTTLVTSTGANALTLANGTAGQIKRIIMVVDGGDATLTPTTKTGYTTIVFNDIADAVTLEYVTTLGWMVLSNNGCTIS